MRIVQAQNEDADLENLSLDSTSCKSAPAQRWCQKRAVNSEVNQFIGTSRGGKTTKIHAMVDGLGNPIYVQLSGGTTHDASVAVDVLSPVDISESTVLADKAYGTSEILDFVQA